MTGEDGTCTLIIFGASGDLSQRKLIPAVYNLSVNRLVSAHLNILGIGRTSFSDEEFRQHVSDEVKELPAYDSEQWSDFSQRLSYLTGSYDDPHTYQQLATHLQKRTGNGGGQHNRLFYLAVPPKVYPEIIRQLGRAGLNRSEHGWTHLIVEKPFGHDLNSARQLNELVHACFEENQVYRIDHYLGKETVQNILAFRFANFIFDELWGRKYIDHIQITAAETGRVEERSGYYDENGVVRDMLQNHLLQLLAFITMEAPIAMDAKELRDEKVKLLRTIRPPDRSAAVLGQYEGYQSEEGVDPHSQTPTFAALKLFIDNRRWQGVPFYLRSGKALAAKATEISVQFTHVANPIFEKRSGPRSNLISFCIQPDEGIHLNFQLKEPGGEMQTSPVAMNFRYRDLIGNQPLPEAYERLILDAIQGDASLFSRSDEIEQAWELVADLLQQEDTGEHLPLQSYPPGTWGPEAADELIRRDGREWLNCCASEEEES
jgi:glucose-6-phosphate 1-dehydrogenase